MPRRFPFLVTLVTAGSLVVFGAERGPEDPLPSWREGPVRYILKVNEDAQYKKLRTEQQRREFIEKFWAGLDPTPGTEVNERRIEFWHRVEQADRLFRDSPYPGWKTDRGKLFILLGPPDYRAVRERGEEWTYRALPQPGSPPEIRLAFLRDASAEYHLLPRALQYQPGIASRDGTPLGETSLSLMAQIAGTQVLKERIRLPDLPRSEVKAEFFFGRIDFVPRYNYYKAVDGTTLVTLTLAIPQPQFWGADGGFQEPDLTLSAIVAEFGSSKVVQRFSERMRADPSWREVPSRPMRYQTAFNLDPGTYAVSFTLYDHRSRRGTVFPETIVVPDFRGSLALSTIAVGRLPLERSDADDPFHLGKLSPLPDPEAIFHEGEEATFSYQVYNAHRRNGETDLDIEYRFFLQTGSAFRETGEPVLLHHLQRELLAYSLALSRWPDGTYLVRVQVTDNVSGAAAIREEKFRVVGSPYTLVPETGPVKP